ncbi:MAG: LamG domain-containing protein, partial [Gemmataceae bacterium]|nr:LamG domain-containing protein [Gemmataceae bacterium]
GAVFTFRTSKGTIIVETDDPDVAVMAKTKDGKVLVIDEKTGRKVEIEPGEYELWLSENGKRLELSADRVNLTRGGKVIVRVSLVKKDRPVPPPPTDGGKPKPPPEDKPVKWPDALAGLMKGKPAIDDRMDDPGSSTFDPTRKKGKVVLDRGKGIRAEFGDGLSAIFDRARDEEDRYALFTHDEGPCGDFACVARARLLPDAVSSWGIELVSPEAGQGFLVRLWNDGRVQIGPGPRTVRGKPFLEVGKTAHKAIRRNGLPNELALSVKGGALRVYVNGEEVLPAQKMPAGFGKASQSLFAYHGGEGPGKVSFDRFRRWELPEEAKPVPESKWPAEVAALMKGKTDIDDDLTDGAKSPFDRFRGRPGERGDKGIGVTAAFGEGGLRVEYARNEKGLRCGIVPHDADPVSEYACLATGRIDTEAPGGWGMVVHGRDESRSFLVRLWNDGSVEIGDTPSTGRGVAVPLLGRKAHDAVRKGGQPNDLCLVVKGGKLRVLVNGTEVAAPKALPPGFALTKQALFSYVMSKEPARVAFTRFRRWPLAGEKPVPESGLPADVAEAMKGEPDIDDRFTDRKTSPFDKTRGESASWGSKTYAIEVGYDKGMAIRYGLTGKGGRQTSLAHDAGPAREYVCRVSGRIESDPAGAWGMTILGREPGTSFAVRLWNSGMVEVGPTKSTRPGSKVPESKKAKHAAIRGGKERNELVVSVKDAKLRVWVNGAEVAGPLDLPEEFQATIQGVHTYHTSNEPGKFLIERFTRWPWPAPVKGVKATAPADLAKRKPDIDDDFRDPTVSPFDPTRGKKTRLEDKGRRISADFSKTEGYVFEAEALPDDSEASPRFGNARPDDGLVAGFACKLVGKAAGEEPAYLGLVLMGKKKGSEFTVRLWNDGTLDTGPFLGTSAGLAYPRIKRAPVKSARKATEKNELLLIAEGGSMRVFVNGAAVGEPAKLPPGMEELHVGFITCVLGRKPARLVVDRYTLWRLNAE